MLLLLGVLVRHLQRFTLGTCHAWAHVPAESILVCASNNLLQARAAEGLSNPNPNPNLNPSLLQWAPLLSVGKLQPRHRRPSSLVSVSAGGRRRGPVVPIGRRALWPRADVARREST